ncbi:hypothetical protein JW707_01470 [Candidatus Woesearchaeota archaeon]|nr:hypothetical protein [Candidatus Woesearchaeota archaeon]
MEIFGPKLKRKGSLQLSINAIVVLILAITILGLGLGFIKKQFGALGAQFEEVSEEIKGEIVQKIRDSGDLLVFNKETINAQIGKPVEFFVGVKNTGAETNCFATYVQCIRALKGNCDPAQPGVPIPVGGVNPLINDRPVAENVWFSLFDEVDIKGGDVGVFPITLQIPGKVSPDTYLMSYEIYKTESGDCEGQQWPSTETPYQSKPFYINVR